MKTKEKLNTENQLPNQNIVYDFNQNTQDTVNQQDLAVMPARLAVRLLKILALTQVSFYDLKRFIVEKMDDCKSEEELVNTCLDFINERDLVKNALAENWDAYKVEPPSTEEFTESLPKVVGKIDLSKFNSSKYNSSDNSILNSAELDETHQNHSKYKEKTSDNDNSLAH
jgi:hypothetical protein